MAYVGVVDRRMPLITRVFGVTQARYYWPLFLHDTRRTGRADAFNVVYVGSTDHYLYALNPDGTLRWRYLAGNQIWQFGTLAIGFSGAVHFGCDDNYVYALNPDGTLKWKYLAGSYLYGLGVDEIDGTVYAGCNDNYLYAIDRNGNLKWSYLAGGSVQCPPLVTQDSVYFGSGDNYLYALDKGGGLNWRYDMGGGCYGVSLSRDGQTVYATAYTPLKELVALSLDGAEKWVLGGAAGAVCTPTVADDGTIHIQGNAYIRAYNPDGSLKWHYAIGSPLTTASPSVDEDGNVYCGSPEGYLYSLDGDGNLRWRYLTGAWIWSSPAITPDRLIIFTGEDGYLYALNPDGTLKWRYNIGGWSDVSPAVV